MNIYKTGTKNTSPLANRVSLVGSHPYASVSARVEPIVGLREVDIIKLGENAGENNEGCPGPKDSLSQGLTRRRVRQCIPVLGVVGIP